MTRQYRLQRRLPLEPLLALFDPVDRTLNAGPGPEFEARTGMSRRQLFRWKAEGGVPERSADKVACAMGLHPSEIWGGAQWEGREEEAELAS